MPMPELLIRPAHGDHLVLEDLLAPSPLSARRPIDRIVLCAHDAAHDELLLEAVRKSGAPLVVDPLTMLLQDPVDPDDPWVRLLPFGRADALRAEEFSSPFVLDEIVAQTVEFQVEHGATTIIPPYFYTEGPGSPAFAASLAAIGRTARRMRADGVSLPLMPLLCARLRGFTARPGWQRALDRFAAAAIEIGPQAIALYLSPLGDGRESYAKLLHAHLAARHLRAAGVPTIAWRQGIYGSALVAAGLDGYECGMGVGERGYVRGFVGARKPRKPSSEPQGGFAASGIYIPSLRRSVPPKVARVLFDDARLRGRVICDSITCCPRGADSMLQSKGRAHAVRSRARELAELAEMPSEKWRLNHIAKQAASSHVTATKANEVLAHARLAETVKTEGYEALEQVAELLRAQQPENVRDTA
jgi:hypothetical protein